MKGMRGVPPPTSFGLGRDLCERLLHKVRIESLQVQMVEDRCILGTREEEGLSLTPLLFLHPCLTISLLVLSCSLMISIKRTIPRHLHLCQQESILLEGNSKVNPMVCCILVPIVERIVLLQLDLLN